MPTYDYRCTACGREMEVMHGVHDRGPETCEACGGRMRKALSTPAIHFRGGGWAKKDAQAQSKGRSGASADRSAKGDDAAKPAAASTGSDGGTASAGTAGGGSTPAPTKAAE